MATQKLICIRCPRGCELTVETNKLGNILSVKGNHCPLGKVYAEDELIHPARILTTSVRVKNGKRPLVSVWTPEAIPKERIMELADRLRNIELEAPVELGSVVLEDPLGIGISVITSAFVEKTKG